MSDLSNYITFNPGLLDGTDTTDYTTQVNLWLASGPSLTAPMWQVRTRKIVVPSTVKRLNGGGVMFRPYTPTTGTPTFAPVVYRGVWDAATSYVTGDVVWNLITASHLDGDGLMWRALTASTGVAPKGPDWTSLSLEAFWTFSSLTDALVSDLAFDVDPATLPYVQTCLAGNCERLRLERINVTRGGAVGIDAGVCTDLSITDCFVGRANASSFAQHGIRAEGGIARVRVGGCTVETSGWGDGHGIVASQGQDVSFQGNTVVGTGTFGLTCHGVVNATISGNVTRNTKHEGCNVIGSYYFLIANNVCSWDGAASQDFGISVDGGSTVVGGAVLGNSITNCGAAGICVVRSSYHVRVAENVIINANARRYTIGGVLQPGILLSGAPTSYIDVCNNTIIDNNTTKNHGHGVAEWDEGNGTPSLNNISNNRILGFAVGDIQRLTNTTTISGNTADLEGRAYTPSAAIEIPGATPPVFGARSAVWRYDGKSIILESFDAVIQTLNTGSGSIILSLPLPADASLPGTFVGKDLATGKAILGEITASGASVLFRYVDNTVGWVNGSRLMGEGRYVPAH